MNGVKKATVILAESHPLFMKGLMMTLQDEFFILGVAANCKELLDLLKVHQPGVILLDSQLTHMDGLSFAKQIAAQHPQTRLIVLSSIYQNEIAEQLRHAGLKGYLPKDVEGDFLISQIKQILESRITFCKPNNPSHFNVSSTSNYNLAGQTKLSARELEIISFIRQGFTSNEIAKALFISINTVEAHRKHIFKKLKLKNIQGLIEYAHNFLQ